MESIMKFVLLISFCALCLSLTAQKKIYAKLRIVYPRQLTYDTLLIKDSESKVASKTSELIIGNKKIVTYLINVGTIDEGSFSIYFGGSSSKVNDTLYFISSGTKLLVEIGDSFALRDHIRFKLSHVYNFEDLYDEYNKYSDTQMQKYDSLTKKIPNLKVSRLQYFLNAGFDFVKNHVANPYSMDLFAVFVINPQSYAKYDEVYQFYSENLKNNIHNSQRKKFVEDKILNLKHSLDEGDKAPDFSAHSIHDKLINNRTLLGKNVLLIFWATWCVPCIKELPSLKQINEEYKDENLVMISVSLDTDSLKMIDVINERKLDWMHVFNNQVMLDAFRINPIPAIFFIDEKGVIIYNSISRKTGTDLTGLKLVLRQKFKPEK